MLTILSKLKKTAVLLFTALSALSSAATVPTEADYPNDEVYIRYIQKANPKTSRGVASSIVTDIRDALKEFAPNVPLPVILAIMHKESTFKHRAVSPDGSMGLMQVRLSVHGQTMRKLGVTDIYDQKGNIRLGVYIFSTYLARARGDWKKAFSGYCGGSAAYATLVTRLLTKLSPELVFIR